MREIDRGQLKRMIDENAVAVVEVLGTDQFQEFHLPGAINVPLGNDFEQEIESALPNKHQAVVVYCKDENCDASPKAAERMEKLGYDRVYDYAPGKMDWKTAGLPIES